MPLCISWASTGQNLNYLGLQQASMKHPRGARNCSRHWGKLPSEGSSLLKGLLHCLPALGPGTLLLHFLPSWHRCRLSICVTHSRLLAV